MDIGIDFSRNDQPPRSVHLTDWEARLVEHCLGLYLAAAEALEDVTVPLCQSALLKVQIGKVPGGTTTHSRQRDRQKEVRRLRRAERDDEMGLEGR